MRRNGNAQPQSPWSNDFKGTALDNDFTLKGNGIMPMTSAGKRRNFKKKTLNNAWVIAGNYQGKKMGSAIRRTIKPQTLAEMLAYARPSTQHGKNGKGFFRTSNGSSPKAFKFSNGFFRRQVSQGKFQQSAKPSLSRVKSTVSIKPSQITLSPKYKEYYQNNKGSTNMIEIESPVDNLTAISGASNTLTKTTKQQPISNPYQNTQGLQGSIYSASNSIDVRTKIEKDLKTKEFQQTDIVQSAEEVPKRAATQAVKIRMNKGAVNRIRDAKKKFETLTGKESSNPLFQYQFEMQNKEEES
jgi:hypothetical protein